MKNFLLTLTLATFSISTYANGGAISSGTASHDEKSLKAFQERTQQNAMKNPRNAAFPESFGGIGAERAQQRMEQRKEIDDFKNDPYPNKLRVNKNKKIYNKNFTD